MSAQVAFASAFEVHAAIAAAHGRDGVRFYARVKTVSARWQDTGAGGADFSQPTMK